MRTLQAANRLLLFFHTAQAFSDHLLAAVPLRLKLLPAFIFCGLYFGEIIFFLNCLFAALLRLRCLFAAGLG